MTENLKAAYQQLIQKSYPAGPYVCQFMRPPNGTNIGELQIHTPQQDGFLVEIYTEYLLSEDEESYEIKIRIQWIFNDLGKVILLKEGTQCQHKIFLQYIYFNLQDFLNVLNNGQLLVVRNTAPK